MAVSQVRGGFWLQHGSTEATQVVAFADELAHTPAGRPGIAFGPVNVPGTLHTLFERARASGEAILDPHGHALDLEPTRRAEQHFPWLVRQPRPNGPAEWESWMRDALAQQESAQLRGAGETPSFVMTASPGMEAARGTSELYNVLDASMAVRSSLPAGTDCWMCVSVDRTYLREEPHLTRLANALVSSNATGIVLRASHSQLPPVDDRAYLEGLQAVIEACSANDIDVFLPNSGWLGWLAMAWGAWGFSGGMAAGTWVSRIRTPMTRPDVPTLPYFEAQLMRGLPWRIHAQLMEEVGYQACTCDDCQRMGTIHDLGLAKRHQLRLANAEGAALAGMRVAARRANMASRLDAAIDFRESLSAPVRGRVGGEFLDRWRALV